MANLSITVSNVVYAFGGAQTDNWGAWNWNAFVWGDGTADLEVRFVKVVDNSLAPDSDSARKATKVIDNSVTSDADMYSEHLVDAAGYSYVFPSNTTEGESRAIPTWTSGTTAIATWVSGTAGSTVWS